MAVATVEVDGDEVTIETEDVYLVTDPTHLDTETVLEQHDIITVTSMALDLQESYIEFVVRGETGAVERVDMQSFAEAKFTDGLRAAEPV